MLGKFAKYFDVEPKYIPVEEGNYVITPEMIREHVDENTIGVCAILGTAFTGDFEPIRDINNMLMDLNKKKVGMFLFIWMVQVVGSLRHSYTRIWL